MQQTTTMLPENRVDELEREYERGHMDVANSERLEELRWQLALLIGRRNLHILREYTDRLAAHYNTEPSWFYQKGLQDGGEDPRQTRTAF